MFEEERLITSKLTPMISLGVARLSFAETSKYKPAQAAIIVLISSVLMVFVITSYSIHYTKLYDACIVYCSAYGQSVKENSHTIDPTHPDVVWSPAPPAFAGCSITILNGELGKPRLDFFFRIESNTDVVRHTHNSAERMILVQGNLEVQYDGEDATVLKPSYNFV